MRLTLERTTLNLEPGTLNPDRANVQFSCKTPELKGLQPVLKTCFTKSVFNPHSAFERSLSWPIYQPKPVQKGTSCLFYAIEPGICKSGVRREKPTFMRPGVRKMKSIPPMAPKTTVCQRPAPPAFPRPAIVPG